MIQDDVLTVKITSVFRSHQQPFRWDLQLNRTTQTHVHAHKKLSPVICIFDTNGRDWLSYQTCIV